VFPHSLSGVDLGQLNVFESQFRDLLAIPCCPETGPETGRICLTRSVSCQKTTYRWCRKRSLNFLHATTIRLQGHWHKTLRQMGDHERDGSLSGLPVLININRMDGRKSFIMYWDPPHVGIGRLKHNDAVVGESVQWDRGIDALLGLGVDEFDAMRVAINETTAAKAKLTATMSVKGWGDDWNQEVPLLITDIQLYSEVDLQTQEGEEGGRPRDNGSSL
jgi:hypothetical protein